MIVVALDSLRNRLEEAIARYRSKVDYLAIRLEEIQETDLLLRRGKLETLSDGISIGGQVRTCHKGGWGFASFNDLDSLVARIENAIASAKLVGDDETILAAVDPIHAIAHHPLTGTDPRRVALADKKALCDRYDGILRSGGDRITTTTVRYGDSAQHVILATSEGTWIEQSWVDMEMRFAATARDGKRCRRVGKRRDPVGAMKIYWGWMARFAAQRIEPWQHYHYRR